jgi:hypothetical protein
MPKKNPPIGTDQDLNLTTQSILFVDENKAREFFEKDRSPDGLVCPHCQSNEVYGLSGREKRPVTVLVERHGNACGVPVENVTASSLKGEIAVNVAKEAVIITDGLSSYSGLRDDATQHRTLKHGAGEYSGRDSDVLTFTRTRRKASSPCSSVGTAVSAFKETSASVLQGVWLPLGSTENRRRRAYGCGH